jgi:hypothetical protein
MQRLGVFIYTTAKHCHLAFFTLLEMRHPRYQLVANTIMDETFLQTSVIRYSSDFGACGQLRFITALNSLTYLDILKKITRPVNLFDVQGSQRADVYNA